MNDLHGGSEELTRAEKIKRIKKIIHQDAPAPNPAIPEVPAPKPAVPEAPIPQSDVPEIPVQKPAVPEAFAPNPEVPASEPVSVSAEFDWERSIARILEKKSQEKKNSGGNTAESILAELFGEDCLTSSPEQEIIREPVPEPEIIREPVPEPEIIPEPVPEPEVIPEPVPEPEIIREPVPEPEAIPEPVPEQEEFGKKKKGKKNKEKSSGAVTKKKKKRTLKQRLLGLFPQKGDKVSEIIRKIVFLISTIAIVVCGYLVGDYYFELWQSKKITEEVSNLYWTYETTEPATGEEHPEIEPEEEGREKKVYKLLPGAEKLLDMNKDVIGYIKIDGTPVDNVILRGEDNVEYLDKKISGEKNRTGELFLDWRNHFDDVDEEGHLKYGNSHNLIIHGHAMKDESMFGSLIKYRTTDGYYSEHPIIYLNSNYSHYTYKIFSVFVVDAEDKTDTKMNCWDKLNFTSEVDFYNFVNDAKRRTIHTNDVDVQYGDQLLTLSTCDTYLGDRGRLIIMARRVREGEDPLEGTQNSTRNHNIKWPTLYYNSNSGKYDPNDFVPYNAPAEEKKPQSGAEQTTTVSSGV